MEIKYNLTPQQAQRFEQLRRMSPGAYEKICKGCGLCCLCKTGTDMITLYTRLSCNCLDLKTRRCMDYNNRLKVRKYECTKVTPELAVAGDLVPRTCGYVEYIYGVGAPINFDWSSVKPLGNFDLDNPMYVIPNIIMDSVNWKRR